ncbi:hypothetical protein M011DRAFT_480171 [Sporormia fimetaria CBS 119925]|uniref:S-adenosyl-L-methionine-dependent methyltransferase n=1 Tax=Sporormia fimetaria CBS 119925 TaxID=1340428 RepID=A0A6A6V0X7_9PLEO|nr:hypothetical protein M011DRAFT_480171 [Sporormia fimetaria CBS 119925]
METRHILLYVLGVTTGLLIPSFVKFLFPRVLNRFSRPQVDRSSIYGLDHGRLHVDVSQLPMWMNMGYWKVSPLDEEAKGQSRPAKNLAEASQSLLLEVLRTAGFDKKPHRTENEAPYTTPPGPVRRKKRVLLDVGFGCGDQSQFLLDNAALQRGEEVSNAFFPFDVYIGVTKDPIQHRFASSRLDRYAKHKTNEGFELPRYQLLCADASEQSKWEKQLDQDILSDDASEERYVLALDCMYHFAPSRWGAVASFSQSFKATTIMGFDLCLTDDVSLFNRAILWVLTTLMRAPWANFGTNLEYEAKLQEVGYEDITIRDVSEQVFTPLAEFLEQQDHELRMIGYGLGPLNIARWVFGWWGRTGTVRGIIFVARHKAHKPSALAAEHRRSSL